MNHFDIYRFFDILTSSIFTFVKCKMAIKKVKAVSCVLSRVQGSDVSSSSAGAGADQESYSARTEGSGGGRGEQQLLKRSLGERGGRKETDAKKVKADSKKTVTYATSCRKR